MGWMLRVEQMGLNDLWELDPSTMRWTWMGGSPTGLVTPLKVFYGQPGVYGELGVPSVANIPGSRYGAATWTDSKGKFWLSEVLERMPMVLMSL